MPRFFNHRGNLQVVGDITVAGIHGFKNGASGAAILATTGITFVGPLTAVATACALGAALAIIPALYIYQSYFKMAANDPFLVRAGVETIFRGAFASGSACLGAALLGYAIAPIGLAALTGSFAFSLLNVMTKLIVEATAESGWGYNDQYLAVTIS